MVTGHPGYHGMSWHRRHSTNAAFTSADAAASRPICTGCAFGSMRQTNTNHLRDHRALPIHPGQQFALDAYTNTTRSYRHYKYCDILTDLATGQSFPLLTTSRSAKELCKKMRIFLDMHPTWRTPTTPPTPRFVRVDPESNYNSELFLSLLNEYSYIVERTPPRDKHANGIAERAVGVIATKTNVAMLAPTPNVPPKYWCLAMSYACTTQSFNYAPRIDDSPYHFTTGQHVDIKHLHPFWARCYVHIPLKDRKGKVAAARAYTAHFVGYLFTSTLFQNFNVLEVYPDDKYGTVRNSKDVIFDEPTSGS